MFVWLFSEYQEPKIILTCCTGVSNMQNQRNHHHAFISSANGLFGTNVSILYQQAHFDKVKALLPFIVLTTFQNHCTVNSDISDLCTI